MIFLFRSGTLREKTLLVLKATRQHATNLAKFAVLYKSGMLALRSINGGKEDSIHAFLAGLGGGYWVFGHGKGASSSVNQQIVIYVFARVVLALAKLAVQPPGDNRLVAGSYGGHGGKGLLGLNAQQLDLVRRNSWPVFATMSWASVMWLFRHYPETLQPSLRSSMTYMYVDTSLPHSVFLFCFRSLLERQHSHIDPCLPIPGADSFLSCTDTTIPKNGMTCEVSFGITDDIHSISLLHTLCAHFSEHPHCTYYALPMTPTSFTSIKSTTDQLLTCCLCLQLRKLRSLARSPFICDAAQPASFSRRAGEARLSGGARR